MVLALWPRSRTSASGSARPISRIFSSASTARTRRKPAGATDWVCRWPKASPPHTARRLKCAASRAAVPALRWFFQRVTHSISALVPRILLGKFQRHWDSNRSPVFHARIESPLARRGYHFTFGVGIGRLLDVNVDRNPVLIHVKRQGN